jgi:hypothetical protein
VLVYPPSCRDRERLVGELRVYEELLPRVILELRPEVVGFPARSEGLLTLPPVLPVPDGPGPTWILSFDDLGHDFPRVILAMTSR